MYEFTKLFLKITCQKLKKMEQMINSHQDFIRFVLFRLSLIKKYQGLEQMERGKCK